MSNQNSPDSPAATAGSHRWRFVRIGGFDHVFLEKGSDLANLDQLDQKLWAALSCPTTGLEFDAKTLEYLDIDEDGRIRAPELIAAVKWAVSMLKNPDDLVPGCDELPLAAIDDSTPEGRDLLASARAILSNLGKASSTIITLEDTADSERIFLDTAFNGDGVITPKSAGDEAAKSVIEDIMACAGSAPDRSGAPGVSTEIVDRFFDEAHQFSEWHKEAEENAAAILPLGDKTAACAEVVRALRLKVDDYFARCALAAFDSRAADALSPAPEQYGELTRKALNASDEEIAAFPLARIQPGDSLPLVEGINPAWAPLVGRLRDEVVRPILGEKKALRAAEWKTVCDRFAAYDAWLTGKRGSTVEKLGLARVREILAGQARKTVDGLIQQDKDVESAANAIMAVDKLLHYRRDLYTLLNNFVSFRDFYTAGRKAIFQAGTLYLDGRSCDLCIRVEDPAAHTALAGLGRTYLAYCECRRKGSSDKLNIAAAFTQGDADNLMVGRNGVFYDRSGNDWEATIVKIVEHPISVRQAFWLPYKRFARMIGEQIEKMASARDKAVDASAAGAVGNVAAKAEAGKPAPPQPFDIGKYVGIFAAISIAIGAIGTAVASVVAGFMGLAWWQMPLAIVGALLAISGPSMIIASLKLHQRNLAPLLDACGWAINARAMINIPFGTSLTAMPRLPENASRMLKDPFAEKKKPWALYLVLVALLVAAVVAWKHGWFRMCLKGTQAKPPVVKVETPKP